MGSRFGRRQGGPRHPIVRSFPPCISCLVFIPLHRITIDSLLKLKFVPTRTVVLAFGIDEEASGLEVIPLLSLYLLLVTDAVRWKGAGHLAVYFERKYGKDGFAMLVDEGGGFFPSSLVAASPHSHPQGGYINQPGDNPILAFPEVSEKGYLDARIEVKVPGGHSSVPPLHTVRRMFHNSPSLLSHNLTKTVS